MRRALFVLAATIAAAPADAGPAGYQALDLEQLYAPRVRLGRGVPVLSIGVAESESQLELELVGGAARVDYQESNLPKRSFAREGAKFRFRVVDVHPARRLYWVEVGQFPPGARADADALAARFAPRKTRIESTGIVFAVRGRLLDTRELRVWVGAYSSKDKAESLAAELLRKQGIQGSIRSSLDSLPHGTIEVQGPEGQRFRAQDLVHLGTFGDAALRFGARKYAGHVYVVISAEGRLSLVHSVDAETLLRGLVPAEIFANAPPAALEAQAIVARGAIFALLAHRHFSDPFHLCDEQHCQVYKGSDVIQATTDAAVAATRGQLLVRSANAEGPLALVPSLYSASCGGHTEDNEVVWDQRAEASLRGRLDGPAGDPSLRPYRDGIGAAQLESWLDGFPPTYCAKSSFTRADRFRWEKTLDGAGLTSVAEAVDLPWLSDVKILGRGRGGRVTGLRLHGPKRHVDVLRELPVRRLFGNLRSGAFALSVDKTEGRVSQLQFRGAGFGHGVGMCQMGAIGRAEAGHAATEILDFYYGGAVLERFY